MKGLLTLVGSVVVVVILIVLFVPGLQDLIEGYVLGWLARLAG